MKAIFETDPSLWVTKKETGRLASISMDWTLFTQDTCGPIVATHILSIEAWHVCCTYNRDGHLDWGKWAIKGHKGSKERSLMSLPHTYYCNTLWGYKIEKSISKTSCILLIHWPPYVTHIHLFIHWRLGEELLFPSPPKFTAQFGSQDRCPTSLFLSSLSSFSPLPSVQLKSCCSEPTEQLSLL